MDHEEAESLIKYADDAMYLAKQQGKNRFVFASDLR
jgi:PleD family two-component response regulator